MANYVIKSWKLQETPVGAGESNVKIEGRAAGLLSWLLNLIKVSPTVSLSLTEDKITFAQDSLDGSMVFHTPLEKICSTFYGYRKHWKEAVVVSIICAGLLGWALNSHKHTMQGFGGIAAGIGIGIAVGIGIGILYYYLKKTLALGYTDIGGHSHAISFQRSVIEGQNIDEAASAKVCMMIQRMVDAKRRMALKS